MMVDKWYDMTTFCYGAEIPDGAGGQIKIDGIACKIAKYAEKMGKPPTNVVIDSVSQIWMDTIEKSTLTPDNYGSQGAEVTRELGIFVKFVHEYLELNGVNVILLNHVMPEKSDGALTGALLPFGGGKFATKGGFYGTVNESLTITMDGQNRVIWTRSIPKMARTTLTDIPDKYYVENTLDPKKSKKLQAGEEYFSLKTHLDKLVAASSAAVDFRL